MTKGLVKSEEGWKKGRMGGSKRGNRVKDGDEGQRSVEREEGWCAVRTLQMYLG